MVQRTTRHRYSPAKTLISSSCGLSQKSIPDNPLDYDSPCRNCLDSVPRFLRLLNTAKTSPVAKEDSSKNPQWLFKAFPGVLSRPTSDGDNWKSRQSLEIPCPIQQRKQLYNGPCTSLSFLQVNCETSSRAPKASNRTGNQTAHPRGEYQGYTVSLVPLLRRDLLFLGASSYEYGLFESNCVHCRVRKRGEEEISRRGHKFSVSHVLSFRVAALHFGQFFDYPTGKQSHKQARLSQPAGV